MTRPEPDAEFGAGYWEHRYRSTGTTPQHGPSPSLIAEAGGLAPGRALDAGCGPGADAIWLAARGWRVTAVDVSAAALAQAREAARTAGRDVEERIAWVHADLTAWDPGADRFDLVTSHYVHVPGPVEDLVRRLASTVAPGGTLLVVGHDGEHGRDHGAHGDGGQGDGARGDGPHEDGAHEYGAHDEAPAHPPAARLRAEQVTAVLAAEEWQVDVAERRTSVVRRPDGGTAALHDVVVRARRV